MATGSAGDDRGRAGRDAAGRSCRHDRIHPCYHPHPARRDDLPRRVADAGVLRRPPPTPSGPAAPRLPATSTLARPCRLTGASRRPAQRIRARGGDSGPPAAALHALGGATRRALVEELRGGERSVVELIRRAAISQPAVSRHLRLLRQAGLVEDQAAGARRLCRLRRKGPGGARLHRGGVGRSGGPVPPGGREHPRPRPSGDRALASSSTWRASQTTHSGSGRSGPRYGGCPHAPHTAQGHQAGRRTPTRRPGLRARPRRDKVDWGTVLEWQPPGACSTAGTFQRPGDATEVLKALKIPPVPQRQTDTAWRTFLHTHAAKMLATDFSTWIAR